MLRLLLFLYLFLSLLNLYAEQRQSEALVFFSKPLLLTVLSLWFYLTMRPLRARRFRLILVGLIFSIGGDVLLMFVENGPKSEDFFLLGLGSFLLAQLCYLLGFSSFPGARNGAVAQNPARAWPFLIYLIAIMGILWNHIPPPMRLPVGLYSIAIVGMAISAYNLRSLLSRSVFITLMAGVLLFVLSDSLIALNKFMENSVRLPYPRILIMATYLAGQYLIASGVTKTKSITISEDRQI